MPLSTLFSRLHWGYFVAVVWGRRFSVHRVPQWIILQFDRRVRAADVCCIVTILLKSLALEKIERYPGVSSILNLCLLVWCSGIPGRIPVVHIKSQMTHCHVIAVLNPAVQLNMRVREASLFGGLWLWFCFWNYMHHMADLMLVPLTPAIPVLPGPTVLGALTVCSLL